MNLSSLSIRRPIFLTCIVFASLLVGGLSLMRLGVDQFPDVTFPVVVSEPPLVADLFAMTPYRWHAPPDIATRLADAAGATGGLVTEADVVVTVSRRTPRP